MYYDMQMDIVMESSNEAFLNINFKSIKDFCSWMKNVSIGMSLGKYVEKCLS